MDWGGIKDLAHSLSVEKDALHVYAAFVIQVGACYALRRPLSSWLPWTAVLLAAVLNEVMDIWLGSEAQVQEWQLLGARHDILNTMVLPTLLLFLCRFSPSLFRPSKPIARDRAETCSEPASGS